MDVVVQGDMASLTAGAGGIEATSMGGASIRTPRASAVLDGHGDGKMRTTGRVALEAMEINGSARTVKIAAKGPAK